VESFIINAGQLQLQYHQHIGQSHLYMKECVQNLQMQDFNAQTAYTVEVHWMLE